MSLVGLVSPNPSERRTNWRIATTAKTGLTARSANPTSDIRGSSVSVIPMPNRPMTRRTTSNCAIIARVLVAASIKAKMRVRSSVLANASPTNSAMNIYKAVPIKLAIIDATAIAERYFDLATCDIPPNAFPPSGLELATDSVISPPLRVSTQFLSFAMQNTLNRSSAADIGRRL